jgi:hypothetical protein
MNQRIRVKTKPLMTVPKSESKGFFNVQPPRVRGCYEPMVAAKQKSVLPEWAQATDSSDFGCATIVLA